jgi:hypothetical protein
MKHLHTPYLLPVVFGKAALLKLKLTVVVMAALAYDASFTCGI